MIGIVIVSHSAKLAEGVVELACSMGGADVRIRAAGGMNLPGQPLGTDPLFILNAIEEVYSDDGVLVLMDLGSALLSAEMAVEMFFTLISVCLKRPAVFTRMEAGRACKPST